MEEESPQMSNKTIAAGVAATQSQSQSQQHQRNLSLSRPPSFTTDDIMDSSTSMRTQQHQDDDYDDIQFFHHRNNYHLHHQFQTMKFSSTPMSSMQSMAMSMNNGTAAAAATCAGAGGDGGEDDADADAEERIISMSPNAAALQQLTDFNCTSENPFAFPDNVMEYGEPQFFPGNCVGYLETILEETDEDYDEQEENGEDHEEGDEEEEEEGCSGRHWWADSDTDTDSVIRVAADSASSGGMPVPANSKYSKMTSFKPPNNYDRINTNANANSNKSGALNLNLASAFRATATSRPFEMEDLHLLDQLDLAFEETLMKPRRRTGFAFDQYDLSLLEPALNAEALGLPKQTQVRQTECVCVEDKEKEKPSTASEAQAQSASLSKQLSQESQKSASSDDSSEQPHEVNEEDFFYSSPSSQDEDEEGQSNTTTTTTQSQSQSQSLSKTQDQASTSRSRTSSMSSCSSCRSSKSNSNSSGSTCTSGTSTSSSSSNSSSDEEGGESQGVVLAEFSLGVAGASSKSPPYVSNLAKNNRSSNRRSFELPSASKLRSFRSFDGLNSLSGTDLLFSGADTFPSWNNDGKQGASTSSRGQAEAPPSSPTVIENPNAAKDDLYPDESSSSIIPSTSSHKLAGSKSNEDDLVVSRKNSGEMSNENLSCDSGLGSSTGNLLNPSTSMSTSAVAGNYSSNAANFLGKTEFAFALNPTMVYSSLSSSASAEENQSGSGSGSSFMSFSNCPESNVDDTIIANKTVTGEEGDSSSTESAKETDTDSLATEKNADKTETTQDKGREFAASSNPIPPLGISMNDDKNEIAPNLRTASDSSSAAASDLDSAQQNNLHSKQEDASSQAQAGSAHVGGGESSSFMQMNNSNSGSALIEQKNEQAMRQAMNANSAVFCESANNEPSDQTNACGMPVRGEVLDCNATVAAAAELKEGLTSRGSLATDRNSGMTNRNEQQQLVDPSAAAPAVEMRETGHSSSSQLQANCAHPDQIKKLPEHERGEGAMSQRRGATASSASPISKSVERQVHLHNPNADNVTTCSTSSAVNEDGLPTTTARIPKEDEHEADFGESLHSMGDNAARSPRNIHKNAVKQENYENYEIPKQEQAEIESSVTAVTGPAPTVTMLHEYESGSALTTTATATTAVSSQATDAATAETLNRNNGNGTSTNDMLNTQACNVNTNAIQDQDTDRGTITEKQQAGAGEDEQRAAAAGAFNDSSYSPNAQRGCNTIPDNSATATVRTTASMTMTTPPPINNTDINNGNPNEEQQQQRQQQQMRKKNHQRRFPAHAATASAAVPSPTQASSSNQQSVLSFDSANTSANSSAAANDQIQVLDDLLDLLLTKPSDSVLAIQNSSSSRRRRAGAIKSETVNAKQKGDSILRDSNFGPEHVDVNVSVGVQEGEPREKKARDAVSVNVDTAVDDSPSEASASAAASATRKNPNEEVVKTQVKVEREEKELARVEVSESLCVRERTWVCIDDPTASSSAPEPERVPSGGEKADADAKDSSNSACAISSSLDIVPDILLVQANNFHLNCSSECVIVAAEPKATAAVTGPAPVAAHTSATMEAGGAGMVDTPPKESSTSPVARQLKTYGEHNQVEVYLVSSRTPSPSTPTNQSSTSTSSDQTTIHNPQSSSSDCADGAGGTGTLGSVGSDSTRCGSLTKASRTVHFSPVVSEISWRESYTDQGSEFSESSDNQFLDDDHLARNEVEGDDDDDDDEDEDEYDVQANDARAIEKVRVHSSNITEPDKIWLRVTDQTEKDAGVGAGNDSGDGNSPDPEERLEYDLELGGIRNKSPAQRPTVLLTMVPDLLSQCEEKVSSTTTPTTASPSYSGAAALSPSASASASAAATQQLQRNPLHVEGKIDERLVPQSKTKKDPSSPSTSKIPSSYNNTSSKYKNGYPEEDVIQAVPQPQQILPSKFAADKSASKKEKGRSSGNNGNKKSTSGASAPASKNNAERKLGSATFLGLRSESSSSKKPAKEKAASAAPEKQQQPQELKEKESKPGFFQRLGKLRLSGSSNKKKRDKIYPKEKENSEPPNKKMAQPTTTTVVVTLKPKTGSNAGAGVAPGSTSSGAPTVPILKKNGVNYQQQHEPYSPPSSTSPEDGVSPSKDQHQKEQEDACSEAFESILDEIAGIKAIQQRQQARPAGSRTRTFAERKQFMSNPDIDQSINASVNEPGTSTAGAGGDGRGIDLLDSKLSAFKEDTHRTRDQISKSQPDLETIERVTIATSTPANKSKLTPSHSTPNNAAATAAGSNGSGSPLNTSTNSNTNKKTEREWYKLLKSAAEKYYHGSSKSSKSSKSNPNLILTNTNPGTGSSNGNDMSLGLPPAPIHAKNHHHQQQHLAYNGAGAGYGSSKTGIVETDLDTGTSREMLDAELVILDVQQSIMKSYYPTSPTNTNSGSGTGGSSNVNSSNGAGAKAKSLTNLTTHGLKLSLVPGATSILDDDNHLNMNNACGGIGMDDDERTKSLEFLLDDSPTKRNGGAGIGNNYNNVAASYLPPENKLCQENRQLSEHELRIQRSLSKLNVPDWYLRHNQSSEFSRGGTLPNQQNRASPNVSAATTATKLLKRSEYGSAGGLAGGWPGLSAYRTPSLSSLHSGSGRYSGSLSRSNFVRGRPATMSASAARSSRESLLSPSSTASQSPSAFERSSFTYGMPFSLTRYGHSRLSSTSGASPSVTPPSTPGLKLSVVKQPYLGWRSQERLNLLNNGTGSTNGTSTGPKLSVYRPPAERLAAEVLTLRQQRGLSSSSIVRPTGADRPPLPPQRSEKTSLSSHKTPSISHPNLNLPHEVPSIHDSIREVTNAINEFVSLGQEPPPKPTPRQKPGKKQQIVWMESSFVGRRPPENNVMNHQQSVSASPYQC